jgi:hypothetical protein
MRYTIKKKEAKMLGGKRLIIEGLGKASLRRGHMRTDTNHEGRPCDCLGEQHYRWKEQ